jgi:hypothetical protein
MTTRTYQTIDEGKAYEIVTDAARRFDACGTYMQVYRLRKDGSRGLKLSSVHIRYHHVVESVRAQMDADRANDVYALLVDGAEYMRGSSEAAYTASREYPRVHGWKADREVVFIGDAN